MELLSKEQILGSVDIKYEIVDVPEWGGKVRVKALMAHERDAFEASLVRGTGRAQKQDLSNVRAKLAALTIVDVEGNSIFSLTEAEALGKKSAAALDRVYDVAARLSKITPEDVEELVGKSEQTAGSAS